MGHPLAVFTPSSNYGPPGHLLGSRLPKEGAGSTPPPRGWPTIRTRVPFLSQEKRHRKGAAPNLEVCLGPAWAGPYSAPGNHGPWKSQDRGGLLRGGWCVRLPLSQGGNPTFTPTLYFLTPPSFSHPRTPNLIPTQNRTHLHFHDSCLIASCHCTAMFLRIFLL